jgi:hypothetical protein
MQPLVLSLFPGIDLLGRGLTVAPITLRAANAFVAANHRTHRAARGCRFCVAVLDAGRLCGVAIAGRPVSRILDDGVTLEVTRCCTDGTRNACSKLYGAVRRAAGALGYRLVLTYTLPGEGGASLRAAGFACAGATEGGAWSCPSRPRLPGASTAAKWRWESRP